MGRMYAYGEEEVPASGVRRLIRNRVDYGISTLKIGAYRKGKGDNKTSTLADFSPATTEEMENHFPPNTDMNHAWMPPYSLDFPIRSIENQNLIWPLICGAERYPERGSALDFLILRNEGNSEFPPALFWKPFGNGRPLVTRRK